jgi:hypothetical protein
MYIRTECGKILISIETEQDMYYYKGERFELHADENIIIHQSGDIIKIKSKGHILKTVLEDSDIISYYWDQDKECLFTHYVRQLDKELLKYKLTIISIITHEQYMKLAQEIK